MFFAEGQIKVFLYGQPTDMRRSFDGLQALARHAMGKDPLDGSLYVFVNRRGTQVRVLYFDRSGFCVWSKRLEAGRFIVHQKVETTGFSRSALAAKIGVSEGDRAWTIATAAIRFTRLNITLCG